MPKDAGATDHPRLDDEAIARLVRKWQREARKPDQRRKFFTGFQVFSHVAARHAEQKRSP